MQIKIKQVPNDFPNADGEWIIRECNPLYVNNWEYLSTLCESDHHAVKVEKEENKNSESIATPTVITPLT